MVINGSGCKERVGISDADELLLCGLGLLNDNKWT